MNKNAQKVWLMTTDKPVKHDLRLKKYGKFSGLIVTYYFLDGIEQGYQYSGLNFIDSTKGRIWHINRFNEFNADYISTEAYKKAINNCIKDVEQ